MRHTEKITRLLARLRWNETDLADTLGEAQSTIHRTIHDKPTLAVQRAIKIAQALNVDAGWLWDDSQPWREPPALGPVDWDNPAVQAKIEEIVRKMRKPPG